MENKDKKCSFKDHKEIEASCYCIQCKIFLCNKCRNYHIGLFQNHYLCDSNKNIKEIFTGYCKDHPNKLDFFCKSHNQLCCAACIAKIQAKGNGQHKDCSICIIEEIKDEKRNLLKKNLVWLEELSPKVDQKLKDFKMIFNKINENKEELKSKLQKLFTKIRNKINQREDELLKEIDEKYNENYSNEDIIKESEKLPNKIKKSIEKGKLIDKEWNNDNLNSLIDDCINIEKTIMDIKIIDKTIEKCNSKENYNFDIILDEDEINSIISSIKINYQYSFKFQKCPHDINEDRKFLISGEKENIMTKVGQNNIIGTICINELEENKEYNWKIKILHSRDYDNNIMVGVATSEFDINSSIYNTCGWYLHCRNSTLYSGPPHNYNGQITNLNRVTDEIVVNMNMKTRTLKFIIDNEDRGNSYTDIPIDKKIFPAVFLYETNDSIEIINLENH